MNAEIVKRYIALSGGIGGAKLALGLSRVLGTTALTVIANTGDDFEHLGLYISPDIDTLIYTLAGMNNTELGWGRRDESWNFMEAAAQLGLDTWFQLGDRDLAMHIYRSERLRGGATLSQVTAELAAGLSVATPIAPMSDQPLRTVVETDMGRLPFQEYFVRHRCKPDVVAVRFEGTSAAQPSPAFAAALADANLTGVIICPSNPFLSVQPILEVPGVRDALRARGCPLVLISPIVAGKAIKGPTARIMRSLGMTADAVAVARLYQDIADGIIIDSADAGAAAAIGELGLAVHTTGIVMRTLTDRTELARRTLAFIDRLRN